MPFKFVNIPRDFECSLTHDLMVDPVFTADGETYEREAIARWLGEHDTSPHTNECLEHKNLTPNRKLKSQISDFVETNRKDFEKEFTAAAKAVDLETLKLLLKLGINVNTQDPENGCTALHYAVNENHQALVALLLEDESCHINADTASVDFSAEGCLVAARQKIEGLLQQRAMLNDQLVSLSVLQDLKRYDALEVARQTAIAAVKTLEAEAGKLNKEAGGLKSQIEACKLRILQLQEEHRRRHEAIESNSQVKEYRSAVKRWNDDIASGRYGRHSFGASSLEEARQNLSGAQERLASVLSNYAFVDIYSPEILAKESEKKVLEQKLLLLTAEENALHLRISAIQNKKIQFFIECLKREFKLIVTQLITFKIIDPSAELVFDMAILRPIVDAHYSGFDAKKILDIKKQLDHVEESILKADSDSRYFLPYTAARVTPLLLAASQGHAEMVALLLDRQADPCKVDSCQATVFHHAARSGQPSLVALLLRRGMDVQARDQRGCTPLDIARAFGWVECVKLIEDSIQEQQTLLMLEKYLQPLRDEIQALRLQVKQLSSPAQQAVPSAATSSADSQPIQGNVTFIGAYAQASAARRASPVAVEPPQQSASTTAEVVKGAECKL